MTTFVILGRFSHTTAADYALPKDTPGKPSAEEREAEIRRVVEDLMGGELVQLYWTLGEYDLVMAFNVSDAEKAGATALGLATRLGIGTTTLTAFDTAALQPILDDGGYAGHG